MSTKSTIFITGKNEHCYEETAIKDNGESRVYLAIAPDNIKEIQYDNEGIDIGINGDSELAKCLKTCCDLEDVGKTVTISKLEYEHLKECERYYEQYS